VNKPSVDDGGAGRDTLMAEKWATAPVPGLSGAHVDSARF